jgi:regulator of sigma E protease
MIGTLMGATIAEDFKQLPVLVAMLSLDIALINLLPFPGLDGGHLIVVLINGARKKPLNEGRIGHWAFVGTIVLSLLSSGMPLCLLRGHQKRSK